MVVGALLGTLARRADARVFCATGSDSTDEARLLRLSDGIRLTTTPRAANILLVAGHLGDALVPAALAAHDALAPPRATVWWCPNAGEPNTSMFPGALVVEDLDPVAAVRRIHGQLLTGERDGEAPLLPDVEPAEWRGVGPYGQGGKGMTGGVPYGRPMAERAADRDGLKLDQLPVRFGPLFFPFPTGLALDVRLQGDLIQEVKLENYAGASKSSGSVFLRSLSVPVPVRELELARARSHLHWLSDAVAVTGSTSLSERILRLAGRIAPGDGDAVRALEKTLRRRGFFGWATRGIGVLEPRELQDVSGPVARSSGLPVDARLDDPAYRRLRFEPLVQDAGDAAARWLQRVGEAVQALHLAESAGEETAGGLGVTESPRGSLSDRSSPSQAVAHLVPRIVTGMEWGEAVVTVVSLDLDMSEVQTPVKQASPL